MFAKFSVVEFDALLLDSVAGRPGKSTSRSGLVASSPDLLPLVTTVSILDLLPVTAMVLGPGAYGPRLECISCPGLIFGLELD